MKAKKQSAPRMPDEVVDAWARFFIDTTEKRQRGELPPLAEVLAAKRAAAAKSASTKAVSPSTQRAGHRGKL